MNAIIDLKVVPDVLKCGIVVPIYVGGGKDPLKVDNYRGVTLSSVFSKLLEFLILECIQDKFAEASILHVNQSAYMKVSCLDTVFATQEVNSRYLKGRSLMFMCLYDMQKAFDSVKYSVLLLGLYEAGVNGKVWRLLRSWYVFCVVVGVI